MGFPSFNAGEVLTAADMNAVGLWLVKSQPIGAGASNVVVTNAFSTDFDNYKITLTGGVGTGIANYSCVLGSTATGYFSSRIKNQPNNGSVVGNGIDNSTSWGYFGQGNTGWINVNCDVLNPFLARTTVYNGSYMIENGSNSEIGTTQGFQTSTTSFTGFTITFGGTTVTGATLRVYGYRK
jgi:hypothetical protein